MVCTIKLNSYEVNGNCKGKPFSDASTVGNLIIRVIIKV